MANINKNEIGYNENTTANALMVQYGRRYAAPMDISEVFTSLELAQAYAQLDPISYAGQKISVAGEGLKTEVYKITSGGTLIRLVDEEDIASISSEMENLATKENLASAVTESKTYVDGKLVDYATKSYVTDQIVSAMTGGEIELTGYAKEEDVKEWDNNVLSSAKTYTDESIATVNDNLNWIPVDGDAEKHPVKHWRGSRANYELLVKTNYVNEWTRYVVIDNVNGTERITEYYGVNQISELTGQMLPVNSIIASISEITPTPYDRYLVGSNGVGYSVYEYVIDSEGTHKWIIKPFDYRYGVRVKDRGLRNYVYVDGELITYDEIDCGSY